MLSFPAGVKHITNDQKHIYNFISLKRSHKQIMYSFLREGENNEMYRSIMIFSKTIFKYIYSLMRGQNKSKCIQDCRWPLQGALNAESPKVKIYKNSGKNIF